MRLAYLSPLPPSTSGIADYSAALLGELACRSKIDLYSDSRSSDWQGTRVRPIREFEREAGRYDTAVYQIGNSPAHAAIHDAAVRHPGIVVLHDGTLHHLFVDRTLHRGDAAGYLREMAYAHGEGGYDAAGLIARGAGVYPFYRFPLIRRLVDSAHGVIVHSQSIREAVRQARPDVPVRVVDHLAFPPVPPRQSRASMLAELGWPDDSFVVASFGQVTYGKRAEIALEGFAAFAGAEKRARFFWAGDLMPEYDLRPLVREMGIEDRVCFLDRVRPDDLCNYLALCDVAVNLRYPTSGEASGGVMRLLAYGKPTLVSRVGWFAELPPDAVAKIDVGPGEVEAIAGWLGRLAADRNFYDTMSGEAFAYAAVRTPARAAEEYLEFVSQAMEGEHARAF